MFPILHKHILLYFVLLFLSSCITEVEFRQEEIDPQPVINAIAVVGEPLSVRVTRSATIFSRQKSDIIFRTIRDATVTLSVNGVSETLAYDTASGIYCSQSVIGYSDSLDLSVLDHEKKVTASIRVIDAAVDIDTTFFTTDSLKGCYEYLPIGISDSIPVGWRMDAVTGIAFTDPADRSNYYMASYIVYLYQTGSCDTHDHWFEWESTGGEISRDDYLLADMLHNGQSVRVNEELSLYAYTSDEEQALQIDSLVIEYTLFSIDDALYQYLQTAYSNQELKGFLSLFAEPVQVYSNIQGSMGIFGSVAPKTKRVRIF